METSLDGSQLTKATRVCIERWQRIRPLVFNRILPLKRKSLPQCICWRNCLWIGGLSERVCGCPSNFLPAWKLLPGLFSWIRVPWSVKAMEIHVFSVLYIWVLLVLVYFSSCLFKSLPSTTLGWNFIPLFPLLLYFMNIYHFSFAKWKEEQQPICTFVRVTTWKFAA